MSTNSKEYMNEYRRKQRAKDMRAEKKAKKVQHEDFDAAYSPTAMRAYAVETRERLAAYDHASAVRMREFLELPHGDGT